MTTGTAAAYARLEARFARLGALDEALAILHWDLSTVMPAGSGQARGEQMAHLKGLAHEILTAPEIGEWLDRAESDEAPLLSPWQAANLREMRRDWIHAVAVPGDLVEALSKACSECELAWRQARPANDFKAVRGLLAEILSLTRAVAHAKAEKLGCSPYDALLDQYEPGGSSARIDPIFDDLAAFLPSFLAEVQERQGPKPHIPKGRFDTAAQKALAERLMAALGFDRNRGRLDESLHPFCGGTSRDVRITTRYDEEDFSSSLMGVLHETGHALYEFGLPASWQGQPVGRARGMSIHESQSLLIEMQACRSRAFIQFLTPLLAEHFGGGDWRAEDVWRVNNHVEPGFIRVDADEVTYPAHVILRYRLEKAMIDGRLEVADLPDAWNASMQDLLGLTPPDDRRGCLQDIHWFDGAFGYFPTYSLGAMTAAQFFAAAKAEHPEIPACIAKGDFAPLLAWLRKNVHGKGSLLSNDDLIRQATGKTLDAAVFKQHLRARYLQQEDEA